MLKKVFFIFLILSLSSCGTIYSTSSDKVEIKDTGRALNTDLGVIIDVVPVKIKGETSNIGAVTGAIIGGIASQKVGSGTGKDIAIVAGTVAGGVIGYFLPVKIGEHNGFQYTISLDNSKNPISIIQSISNEEKNNHKVGDRVTIIYGNQVRVIPSKN
jgi:outer membrane lipoprotein SlyB